MRVTGISFRKLWLVTSVLFVAVGACAAGGEVIPGIEVLALEQGALLQGKRVGFITNHSAVDRRLRHAIDILAEIPGVKLAALFAPEHGIRGMAQAGDKVVNTIDERTGVPIYSIYGETRRPTPEMLAEVDVLVYDIQDVGVRFYTYISTMGECMEAAADKGIPFIVLDRPNPLADTAIEGRMLDLARFRSFVGAYELPIRYGLTAGELAQWIRGLMKQELDLEVVRMKNWRRGMWYDETGLAWIPPSPNIPALDTAIVYPGMCLIEGTNLSEGRGTTKPFEMIGAPWVDGYKLAEKLNALNLTGVRFRPASFTPTISKHQGQGCQGIQVHVADRKTFRPVQVALHVLSVLRKEYPSQFAWRESSIDRLSGSDELRLAIDQGKSVDQILASWAEATKRFDEARKKYFLYPE